MARTNSERKAEKKDLPSDGVARGADEENARAKRVLLVDDHNLFRGILAVICEKHTDLSGNVQAGSLTEARRILSTTAGQASDFALAVVDLDLEPEEGGVELIGELRRAGIPVLALTTRSQPSAEGLLVGSHFCSEANEVLSTAASSDELLGTVKRLMGASS